MPAISSHLRKRVAAYFQHGENSIKVATSADLTGDAPPTDRVCVECQMAAEFFLKTFLLANKQRYRKYGHDIVKVLDKCIEIDSSFHALSEPCNRLQDFKPVLEYVDDIAEFPTVRDTLQARSDAQAVQAFIADRLRALGFLSG